MLLYLIVLGKGDGSGLHVQYAGDGISLREGGQYSTQLSTMVQAATIGTVKPHVYRGAVVEVSDGPAGHPHTRALIPSVLLGDVKLKDKANILQL